MKIIYIANARMPTEKAHGIQIIKMCQAFSRAGLDVELVLPWRINHIKEESFEYYGIKKSFNIKKLFSIDLIHWGLPFGFWIQSVSFSVSVFIYLFFKKADFIYSRDLSPLFLLSLFKENLIYEAHYLPGHFGLYRGLLKRIKGLVVITQKLKEFYQKKGIAQEKILVIPDGVDLDDFNIEITKPEARRKLNLPLDKKIIMYVGLFDKWKGYLTLLQASKFLNREMKLVMIGGTEKQVNKLREEYPNVIFLGYLPYANLPVNQKAADVLVIPNSGKMAISKYYTSPLKLFSYMASQRPIVASDLPSLREILDENTAVLVKPDNPNALAQGIKTALKNPDFSDNISEQAFRDVRKYTWAKRVEKILNFINS